MPCAALFIRKWLLLLRRAVFILDATVGALETRVNM
jgi:hypothetical protein